jgi:hypothetical protein
MFGDVLGERLLTHRVEQRTNRWLHEDNYKTLRYRSRLGDRTYFDYLASLGQTLVMREVMLASTESSLLAPRRRTILCL